MSIEASQQLILGGFTVSGFLEYSTTVFSDPVTLVKTILDNEWNPANVVKPRIIDGGEDQKQYQLKEGDVVKVYRSRPVIRNQKSVDFEHREDFVFVDVKTVNGRSRMKELEDEITRIINSKKENPNDFFDWMWQDSFEYLGEYPDMMWAVANVTLVRHVEAIST